MEQIVPVPVFPYNNKSLNKQSVTKQELPKYQAYQHPTYRVDSLKRKLTKFVCSADVLVDEHMPCPLIKLSNSQNLVLDGVEFGVLLSAFAQQMRRKDADGPDI